jgi:hypothetical protein
MPGAARPLCRAVSLCNVAPLIARTRPRATLALRWKAVSFPLGATAPQRASIGRVVDQVLEYTIPENPRQESGATHEQRSVVQSR